MSSFQAPTQLSVASSMHCKQRKVGQSLGTRQVISDSVYKLSCVHVQQAAWASSE